MGGREEGGKLRGDSPTILQLQEVLNQVLHEAVLLGHVALEVDHLAEHALVVGLEVPDVLRHLVVRLREPFDLRLHGLDRRVICPVGGGDARAASGARAAARIRCLALRGHFALNVFEGISPVGLEIRVAKRPALCNRITLKFDLTLKSS